MAENLWYVAFIATARIIVGVGVIFLISVFAVAILRQFRWGRDFLGLQNEELKFSKGPDPEKFFQPPYKMESLPENDLPQFIKKQCGKDRVTKFPTTNV